MRFSILNDLAEAALSRKRRKAQKMLCPNSGGIIFIGVCIAFISLFAAAADNSRADNLQMYSVEDVLARIHATYGIVSSASGTITRTVETGDGETIELNGSFFIRRPDSLRVEFSGEDRQVLVFDGTAFRVFYPAPNKGYYQKTAGMTVLEYFILGPEPFFGNMISLLEMGYTITLDGVTKNSVVLRASPAKSLSADYILVRIDPRTWTILSFDQFDSTNRLSRQTRFDEYISSGDSLFFPALITTSTFAGVTERKETTRMTGVSLNPAIENDIFSIPGNTSTVWLPRTALKKQ